MPGRPFGRTGSVIRGGYGLFYGSSSHYRMNDYVRSFPHRRRNAGGVNSAHRRGLNIQSQYLQSWNLTIEHEFARDSMIEAAYAGSKGTHLQRRFHYTQQLRNLDVRV